MKLLLFGLLKNMADLSRARARVSANEDGTPAGRVSHRRRLDAECTLPC